jgi:hypothetical protein
MTAHGLRDAALSRWGSEKAKRDAADEENRLADRETKRQQFAIALSTALELPVIREQSWMQNRNHWPGQWGEEDTPEGGLVLSWTQDGLIFRPAPRYGTVQVLTTCPRCQGEVWREVDCLARLGYWLTETDESVPLCPACKNAERVARQAQERAEWRAEHPAATPSEAGGDARSPLLLALREMVIEIIAERERGLD